MGENNYIECPKCKKKYHIKAGPTCPFCGRNKPIPENGSIPPDNPINRNNFSGKNKVLENFSTKPHPIITIIVAVFVITAISTFYTDYTNEKKAAKQAEIARAEAAKRQAKAERQHKSEVRAAKRKAERIAKRAAMTPAELREEKIRKGFSGWDGSHINLVKLIKNAMNDPDSYKHVETVYADKGDYLIVKTTFRGKNKFGGTVKNWVKAKCDLDGNVIKIIGQGP